MLIFLLLFSFIWAEDVSIFDVRKTLPLKEGEKIYHDYYVSAGTQDGLKKNMLVTVTRKVPFQDTNLSKIEERLVVDVAVLKLIHVQKTFSVARLESLKEGPVLEFSTIMIGDRVDIGSARMPSSTTKEKKVAKKANQSEKKISGGVKPKQAQKKEIKAKQDPNLEQPPVIFSGEVPAVPKNPDL